MILIYAPRIKDFLLRASFPLKKLIFAIQGTRRFGVMAGPVLRMTV